VNNHCKVLIVGQYFETSTGGGITLCNLFKSWNMQDLAVASRDIHNPDTTICKNYYLFGKQENRRIFPFNIHGNRNVPESGQLTFTVQNRNSGSGSEQRKAYYLQAYEWILKTTGLLHVNRELVISDQFMAWINEFSPDVIYTHLSSL